MSCNHLSASGNQCFNIDFNFLMEREKIGKMGGEDGLSFFFDFD